jgi:hypothetical protein
MTDSSRPTFGAKLIQDIESRELKQARGLMLILGAVTLVTHGLSYGELARLRGFIDPEIVAMLHKLELATEFGIAAGVAYLILGVLVSRKPVLATTAGLVLYLGLLATQFAIAPKLVTGGVFAIGTRAILLIALVGAVRFARLYEQNRERAKLPSATALR